MEGGASFYNIRRVVGQLNNSHLDPIFYFIEEFEISFFWGSLAFLYGTGQFCIEPAGLEKTGRFSTEPEGSMLTPANFVWNRPKTV